MEYLLAELAVQSSIEEKARDRAEQMVQYLLTSLAAIIGAVLLLTDIERQVNMVIFLALVLIYIAAVSTYYRFCRLLTIVTRARYSRFHLRKRLGELGIASARIILRMEGRVTGFTPRMRRGLKIMAVVTGLIGAATLAMGLVWLNDKLQGALAENWSPAWPWLVVISIVVAVITTAVLIWVMHHHEEITEDILMGGEGLYED
jgi:hypothetical protein